jgi:hypothetical protein
MEMVRARRLGLQRAVRFGGTELFEVAGRNASAIATIDWREQKMTFADQSCAGLVLRNLSMLVKFDPSEPRDEQGRWTDGGGEGGGSSAAGDKESGVRMDEDEIYFDRAMEVAYLDDQMQPTSEIGATFIKVAYADGTVQLLKFDDDHQSEH